jgi:hypothetical protein
MSWGEVVIEAGRTTLRHITWPGLRRPRIEAIPMTGEPPLEPVAPSAQLLSDNPFTASNQDRQPDRP